MPKVVYKATGNSYELYGVEGERITKFLVCMYGTWEWIACDQFIAPPEPSNIVVKCPKFTSPCDYCSCSTCILQPCEKAEGCDDCGTGVNSDPKKVCYERR